MITFIKGSVVELSPAAVVVEACGVGYELVISLNTYTELKKKPENVLIYTYHHVREDAEILYGFAGKNERELFRLLITVNGIGPSSAISMLSGLDSRELSKAILNENVNALKAIKGIGAKTAQRIILDLKDKIGNDDKEYLNSDLPVNNIKNEALSALEVLGIPKKFAEPIVQQQLNESPQSTVEELIKLTLKKK